MENQTKWIKHKPSEWEVVKKPEHKKRVTFTMDPQLYREMRKLIEKTERSMSWTLCRAVKLLLNEKIF